MLETFTSLLKLLILNPIKVSSVTEVSPPPSCAPLMCYDDPCWLLTRVGITNLDHLDFMGGRLFCSEPLTGPGAEVLISQELEMRGLFGSPDESQGEGL